MSAKPETERTLFEAEYRLMFPASSADPEKFEQNGTGGYEDFQVNNAWRFWQARAALLAADSKAGGEPATWQQRCFLGGKWEEWRQCEARNPDDPLEVQLGGRVAIQFRPLYTRPQQQAKPLTETEALLNVAKWICQDDEEVSLGPKCCNQTVTKLCDGCPHGIGKDQA